MKFVCDSCREAREFAAYAVEDGVLVLTCATCGAKSRGAPTGAASSSGTASRGTASPGTAPTPAGAAGVSFPGPSPVPAAAFASPAALPPSVTSDAAAAKLRVIPFRAGPDPAKLARESLERPFDAPPEHCPKCIAPRPEEGQACAYCGLLYVNFDLASVAPAGAVAEGWRETLRSWDDWTVHERFLTRAAAEGALAAAGRLYRIRLAASPTDPIAARGRDEVLRLAALPPLFAHPSALGQAPAAAMETAGTARPPVWQYAVLGGLILAALAALGLFLRQVMESSP